MNKTITTSKNTSDSSKLLQFKNTENQTVFIAYSEIASFENVKNETGRIWTKQKLVFLVSLESLQTVEFSIGLYAAKVFALEKQR
ncbi:MAG: hypothetical protein M3Q99_16820 [Acidobacteriota bacterium]|nr:hypothetical protein [Acidobacteriota bacterium]